MSDILDEHARACQDRFDEACKCSDSDAIADKSIPELLGILRQTMDGAEVWAARVKKIKQAVEAKAVEMGMAAGDEPVSLSGGGLTVKVDPCAMSARCEPEQYNAVMAWAVEHDKEYIYTRAFATTRVVGMVEAGEALPDGLTLVQYTKFRYTRKG